MPLENSKLPPRPEYPVLEDGTYQVVIKDINDFTGRNYKTGEPEEQYQFDLEVLDEENKGHTIKVWTSKKYSAAKDGRAESKLFAISKKALGRIVNADELDLNDLIGKQIKVVVTRYENESGYERNKVVSFLEAKKEMPVTEKEVVEPEEAEPTKEPEGDEPKKTDDIDLNDIPF